MKRTMTDFNKNVCNFMAGIIEGLQYKLTLSEDGESEFAFKQDIEKNIKMLKANMRTIMNFSHNADFYSNLEPTGLSGVRYVNTVLRSARRANGAVIGAKWRIKAYCAMKQYQKKNIGNVR